MLTPLARRSASAALEVFDEHARADVDDQAVAVRPVAPAGQLGDLADERGREVVDDEEPEVLEHVRGFGTARAGHAGDDRDVENGLGVATSCGS